MDRYSEKDFQEYRASILKKFKNEKDRKSEVNNLIDVITRKLCKIVCADMLQLRGMVDHTVLECVTSASRDLEKVVAFLEYLDGCEQEGN